MGGCIAGSLPLSVGANAGSRILPCRQLTTDPQPPWNLTCSHPIRQTRPIRMTDAKRGEATPRGSAETDVKSVSRASGRFLPIGQGVPAQPDRPLSRKWRSP